MAMGSRAIDDMLCFALYEASRATTQAYRRILKPWGLTYPQYLVLVELWESDGVGHCSANRASCSHDQSATSCAFVTVSSSPSHPST